MQLPYVTERDETLPHQVVFFVYESKVQVSCNCRKSGNSYQIMGTADGDLETARALYNNPVNHRGTFGEEDTAKW